jgi:hypothetical protein
MVDPLQWGLLVPLFAALVLACLATGQRVLPLYAIVWAVVSWLGLSWVYVISKHEHSAYLGSTKERVVASIVLGSAALTPLLAAELWATARGGGRGRPQSGAG